MSLLKREPFAAVGSMEELLAVAYALEQQAIGGYSELAERMRREHRPDLADVFDRLVGEEEQHLGNVFHWSERVSGQRPDLSKLRWQPAQLFDDEGAATIAPELLSAYRAFSTAVRNEERSFLFWTYVAAQTVRDDLREAAEQMAREELSHLAALRRERRQAFHTQRATSGSSGEAWNLAALELRLSDQIEAAAAKAAEPAAADLRERAHQARNRADSIARKPLGDSPILRNAPVNSASGMVPLCELLLDCYLDFGDRLPSETERSRAQEFAAGAVHCLTAIR